MWQDGNRPRPAASVAFVRDSESGIEVYLSRRPSHFRYFPGALVFPGGRAETSDPDLRATACREVEEEIGVQISSDRLVLLRETHTAAHAGPVYHLFIFAYEVEGEFITSINAAEIQEEFWISASEALEKFDLPYQIRVAVHTIASYESCSRLMAGLLHGSMDDDPMI